MLPSLPLLAIVGPTAVGKTSLSIILAERLDGEIISADSRCLYIGMSIGTAKPTDKELARVPHHLIDVTTPDKPWSLAQYKKAAVEAIADIHSRGRLPMLVGGTGQYVRAILEGWDIPPRPGSLRIRRQLECEARKPGGSKVLHAKLAHLDSQAAMEIDARNIRRLIRALEVCLSTGKPFSTQRKRQTPPYQIFTLGLAMVRADLYARIDLRLQSMLEDGLVDEVLHLVESGYTWDMPALSALGYKQLGGYLRGEYDLDEAVRLIKRGTRRFVRQQSSWFAANDSSIHWFEVDDTSPVILEREIKRWLKSIEAPA